MVAAARAAKSLRWSPSGTPSPRFERGHKRIEDQRDEDNEHDIGEHPRDLHALGEMYDAVAESGERGDGLAADDGQQRDGESHAHAAEDDRQGSWHQHIAEEL